QYAELDLSAFEGSVPVELFGQIEFPVVGRQPYFISLGPHAFMWFALERPAASIATVPPVPTELAVLPSGRTLQQLARGATRRTPKSCWTRSAAGGGCAGNEASSSPNHRAPSARCAARWAIGCRQFPRAPSRAIAR